MSAANGAANATPKALEVAQELGVELNGAEGSGRHGRVTVADVRAIADAEAGPPASLTPAGKRIWRDVQAYLEEFELWRGVYAPLMDRYVRNLVRSRWAREEAEKQPVVAGSTGQDVANPLFAVSRNAELDAHRYAEALLLTPEAMKKHLQGVSEEAEELGF